MKFRILKDHYGFYLQHKFLLFWFYICEGYGRDRYTATFKTAEEAEIRAVELVAQTQERVVVKEFEINAD